jgi:hypothetical protein
VPAARLHLLTFVLVVALGACTAFGSSSSSSGGPPPTPAPDASATDAAPSSEAGGALPPGPEAAVLSAPPCNGALACERILFVTSMQYHGDLGGVEGADVECNRLAHATRSPRLQNASFNAWLGTAGAGAESRVVHGSARYVAPTGYVVAESFAALQASGFSHIPSDENGIEIGGAVWTGTGSPPSVCSDWRSARDADIGMRGEIDGTGSEWTTKAITQCTDSAHIYCLEN